MRRLRRLIQKRSLRWSEGVCVLEGPDLIESALVSGVEFEAVYVDESASSSPQIRGVLDTSEKSGIRTFSLSAGVLEKVADAQTPQPLIAAVRFSVHRIQDLGTTGLTLILHEIRDPGNAGTIIRSADAAGVSSVVFTGNSVDPYNPKALRASAGSVFNVPIALGTLDEALTHFESAGVLTMATVVRGSKSHRSVDFTKPVAVVIGNEASGLDEAAIGLCSDSLTIPMAGRNESLNAAIAASLIAFEAFYQREDASAARSARSLEES